MYINMYTILKEIEEEIKAINNEGKIMEKTKMNKRNMAKLRGEMR